jgi:hypothetical protein
MSKRGDWREGSSSKEKSGKSRRNWMLRRRSRRLRIRKI